MTALRPREPGIISTDHLAGIVKIFDRDVNAVVHRRRLDPAIADEALAVLGELCGSRKVVVDAGEHALPALANELGLPPAITADIALWTEVLSDLCDVPLVGVRLARADRATCPRFHCDRVTLRLVVTYVGPGTDLVPERTLDRSRLSPHHGGKPDELSGLIRDTSVIVRARAGDVVVMKGELWPAEVGAIVHRSPPHTTPRLLLTLDPLG